MILSELRRQQLTDRADRFIDNIADAEAYLAERGIELEVARAWGLGVVESDGYLDGRLSIPYYTPSGVVQIKYRCMDPEHDKVHHKGITCQKYMYEAGSGSHLYNAQALIHTVDTVILTEGEIDALTAQVYMDITSVGYPGTQSWKKHPHYRLCFEGIGRVLVIADGDDDGRKAAQRVANSIGIAAQVVDLPDGQDVNSFIVSHAADAFLERINA